LSLSGLKRQVYTAKLRVRFLPSHPVTVLVIQKTFFGTKKKKRSRKFPTPKKFGSGLPLSRLEILTELKHGLFTVFTAQVLIIVFFVYTVYMLQNLAVLPIL
jgi:hypothetical protein